MSFISAAFSVKMRLERPAELVGAKPLHLLTQTALPLKSPTGAFIVLLRSTNANLSFLYFLATEVLHVYFKNLHSLSCVGNFLIS